MEFVPQHFLRCHSKTDTDSADVSTQVWQAVFEPNDSSKMSHLVATCGGNKVCVIDAKTGNVQYRYCRPNSMFYALAWSTACPKNNILATAGSNSTIIFMDLLTKSAYLQYSLSSKSRNVFICSIVFHPFEKKLFCAQNNGCLYILEFQITTKRIESIEELKVIDLECEIIGITFCEKNDCLLIATDKGLMGWNNSQSNDKEIIDIELPKNPNDSYKDHNENIIDSIEVVNGSWIATKVALHGVIYVFNLEETVSKVKDNKCTVKPAYVLEWSDTDNFYMSCGVGLNGKMLACGDDKGSIWIYNLEEIDYKSSRKNSKVIKPHNILKWPKLQDIYLKKKKKLDVDVYDIVIAKCAVHSSGKYLVAVTNNNFVCLYS